MMVRLRQVDGTSLGQEPISGYCSELPSIGNSLVIWYDRNGVSTWFRTGPVRTIVGSSEDTVFSISTDRNTYQVTRLSKMIMSELSSKGE